MTDIRMLTVRQPWAYLLALGVKPVENRSQPLNWRGVVLIHAGLKWSPQSIIERRYAHLRDGLPLGGIIGAGAIVDCVTDHPSPFFGGPYGWVFDGVSTLPFTPARGWQGLPYAPDDVVRRIDRNCYRAALQRALDALERHSVQSPPILV